MHLSGGCLCGDVRYKVKIENTKGYFCHCRMCQLAFGNTHASFLNVKKKNIKWLQSTPKQFASSKFAKRGFCKKCGTPLTFAFNDSENVDISVGSLDHPEKTKPTSHFAYESRVKPWFRKDKLKRILLKSHKALLSRWKQHYGSASPGIQTIREFKNN